MLLFIYLSLVLEITELFKYRLHSFSKDLELGGFKAKFLFASASSSFLAPSYQYLSKIIKVSGKVLSSCDC